MSLRRRAAASNGGGLWWPHWSNSVAQVPGNTFEELYSFMGEAGCKEQWAPHAGVVFHGAATLTLLPGVERGVFCARSRACPTACG